ncbi:MAG: metallophosphoesterase [Gammaproteobacteria bacterium]|jgi:hypothetical protein
MKIHVLNDLHIEFGDFALADTAADVAVLAGDIGIGSLGLEWIGRSFSDRPAIYIPGNHEYYRHDLDLLHTLKDRAPDHVHVLDNDVVTIDGVRFLGTTLWTDFMAFGAAGQYPAMQFARRGMADFSLITQQGRPFTPEDALQRHVDSRNWLESMLAQPFDGKTVVVSHHAPAMGSVHPRFAGDRLTPAFVSDLETLMGGDRVALWIHGHTHDPFDYTVRGTRVVCNPRGYAPELLAAGFRPDLVVEL